MFSLFYIHIGRDEGNSLDIELRQTFLLILTANYTNQISELLPFRTNGRPHNIHNHDADKANILVPDVRHNFPR